MELVKSVSQLIKNIHTLEQYLNQKVDPEYSYALNLIKRGTCFVAVKQDDGEYRFYPSRFIGYVDNTMNKHENNPYKDGRETNFAISSAVGSKPQIDPALDSIYQQFCEKLGFIAKNKGSFGVLRKYWILSL